MLKIHEIHLMLPIYPNDYSLMYRDPKKIELTQKGIPKFGLRLDRLGCVLIKTNYQWDSGIPLQLVKSKKELQL